MQLAVATPPAPLLSWAAIKGHLRADSDDDQALVEGYIAAATTWLDAPGGWLGRAIGAQTLTATMECFDELGCGGEVNPLPYGPITGEVAISYYDVAGAQQTLDPATYRVVDAAGIVLQSGCSWPAVIRRQDAVAVTYGAGFATVPQAIIQAVMLIVGHWYRNRETINVGNIVSDIPFAAEALLSTFRRWS